jgi:hypothetical protein
MMARNAKSSAKAARADHRLPPDERLDREAASGLLPPEELDRAPDSRLTAGDLKRAAAKAMGVMGSSKKLDPSLKVARARDGTTGSVGTNGVKKSRGAAAAGKGLDKGSVKIPGAGPDEVRTRTRRSNAEIAEGVTSTARKSPAPRTARAHAADGAGLRPRENNKRTGAVRQRAPAPGNVVTVPKREATGGRQEAKRSGVRSTSSSGGSKPPKSSARAGRASGSSRARGADGSTIE